MTAHEIMEHAVALLGYSSSSGNNELMPRIMGRAVMIINVVYADLLDIDRCTDEGGFKMISSLSDEIELPSKMQNIMVYGVAAFAAQSEGDSEAQQLWMTVYNRKRAGLSGSYLKNDIFSGMMASEDDET